MGTVTESQGMISNVHMNTVGLLIATGIALFLTPLIPLFVVVYIPYRLFSTD